MPSSPGQVICPGQTFNRAIQYSVSQIVGNKAGASDYWMPLLKAGHDGGKRKSSVYRSVLVVRFLRGVVVVAFGGAACPGPCDSSSITSSFELSGFSADELSAA